MMKAPATLLVLFLFSTGAFAQLRETPNIGLKTRHEYSVEKAALFIEVPAKQVQLYNYLNWIKTTYISYGDYFLKVTPKKSSPTDEAKNLYSEARSKYKEFLKTVLSEKDPLEAEGYFKVTHEAYYALARLEDFAIASVGSEKSSFQKCPADRCLPNPSFLGQAGVSLYNLILKSPQDEQSKLRIKLLKDLALP